MYRPQQVVGIAVLAVCVGLVSGVYSGGATAASAKSVEKGKTLAFDRKKGNCLACHQIAGGVSPGNIGPPLVAMKTRFPDKAVLRSQIWDPTARNPETSMPPFGKHGALTADEIDQIVDFIYTL